MRKPRRIFLFSYSRLPGTLISGCYATKLAIYTLTVCLLQMLETTQKSSNHRPMLTAKICWIFAM